MEVKKKKSAGQSGIDGNDELRTKKLEFYVSPTELSKISLYYEQSHQRTMANFCREKMLSKPGATADKKAILSEISISIYQQSKMGNNFNQIAKRVNSLKSDYPELLDELKAELKELKRLNKMMLSKFQKVGG